MAELVIFIGLQATGKTSFHRARFAATHFHVSKDRMPRSCDREARQNRLLGAALGVGRDAVLDNTNPTRASRRMAIAIAQALGCQVVGYYFDSRLGPALARNAARGGTVPEVALRATASRLERPTLAEGFTRLFHVALRDGTFAVSPWMELTHEAR